MANAQPFNLYFRQGTCFSKSKEQANINVVLQGVPLKECNYYKFQEKLARFKKLYQILYQLLLKTYCFIYRIDEEQQEFMKKIIYIFKTLVRIQSM